MDEADRRRLLRARLRLVQELRVEPLCEALLRRGLFSRDMLEEIQRAGTRRDQARQLVSDLQTRGKRALPDFILCLRDTGHSELAALLGDGRSPAEEAHPRPAEARPAARRSSSRSSPPCRSSSGSVEENPRGDSEMVYLLNSDPCGYCLIINNVNFNEGTGLKCRLGSDLDCRKLEKRFRALHFDVLTREDLTAKGIAQELQNLAKCDHSSLDCCVVVVLSHGCEVHRSRHVSYHIQFPGMIFGTDGQRIAVQSVVSYFNGSHCPSLRGKPKLFFIQACGGEEKDEGFQVDTEMLENPLEQKTVESDATPFQEPGGDHDEMDATASLPTASDILVCYPTFPGCVSWRDTQTGSWFIEALDQVLDQYARLEDLPSILTKVGNLVSAKVAGSYKQMPGYFNFLRKKFFFKV